METTIAYAKPVFLAAFVGDSKFWCVAWAAVPATQPKQKQNVKGEIIVSYASCSAVPVGRGSSGLKF